MRRIETAIMLFGCWLVLSGKFDLVHLGVGAASAIVLSVIYTPRRQASRSLRVFELAAFVPWLLGQILLSNLRVARMALSPRSSVAPVMIRCRPRVTGDAALTLLGCSITLTPGTLTIEADEDHLLVHALDALSRREVERGTTAMRVARVFDSTPGGATR